MSRSIAITESLYIARPPEVVWDYTQDYSRRREWDASILEAEVISGAGERRVRIRAVGGLRCLFVYKVIDRPRQTSLAMADVQSPLIAGGGGSWQYEARNDDCIWTQVAGLTLRPGWLAAMLAPGLHWSLRRQMRKAMRRAKRKLESQPLPT